jgi:hypothetical protein
MARILAFLPAHRTLNPAHAGKAGVLIPLPIIRKECRIHVFQNHYYKNLP